MSNPAEYAVSHWRRYESADEHAERVQSAEQRAGWYFDQATKPQKAAYTQAMDDLRGLSGPRYDRAREAARAAWHASTKDAADLFVRTADEIMRDGEVSEALGEEWDALCLPSYEEALLDPVKARKLFDASKGGNVRGITEDHRFMLADVFQRRALETV